MYKFIRNGFQNIPLPHFRLVGKTKTINRKQVNRDSHLYAK